MSLEGDFVVGGGPEAFEDNSAVGVNGPENYVLQDAHLLHHAVAAIDTFNEISGLDHVANVLVVGVEQLVYTLDGVGRLACNRHTQRELDRDVPVHADIVCLAAAGAV